MSALIAAFFFSFLFCFVLPSSPSSLILFSSLLNYFNLDRPSFFCAFGHNKSSGCLKHLGNDMHQSNCNLELSQCTC